MKPSDTKSYGSNSSWSGQAAVPIPEDYALTSYLYVHIAHRHVSVNYPEAQLEANSLEASFNSYFTFNIPAMNKSFPLFSFERYMPTSFHQFHYISLSLILPLQLLTMQVKARIENEQYLRKHPEIAAMVSSFVR